MKTTLLLLLLAGALSADQQTGGGITLGSSATQLDAGFSSASIDTHYVQRIAIRVIPGYCGKVYIALGSAPNTTNYSNVVKVLYPNCNGGLSDEYVLEDRSGYDGIDSRRFWVSGTNGDQILVDYNQSGTQQALHLVPVTYGAPQSIQWSGIYTWVKLPGAVNGSVAVAQFAIIPGQSGKFWVFTPYGAEKVMYPNNGVVTGTITESYEWNTRSGASAGNTVWIGSGGWMLNRQITGETLLVALWQYA